MYSFSYVQIKFFIFKNWSAKFYHVNTENLQIKLVKDIKVFLTKRKTKRYYRMKKMRHCNCKKLFSSRKMFFLGVKAIKWASWEGLTSMRNFLFRVNLFILRLGMKISIGRQNKESPRVTRNFSFYA